MDAGRERAVPERRRRASILLGVGLTAALLGCAFWALVSGDYPATLEEVASALSIAAGVDHPPSDVWRAHESYAILEVRLPRILAALLVGATLAVAGVLMQGVLLNPLAEPYTLGVSGGAAFGAALALVLGLDRLGVSLTSAFAFAGGCLALLTVLGLARREGRIAPGALILAGVIVAAILAAGISCLKYLANEEVGLIVFWLMGSFGRVQWMGVALVAGALFWMLACGWYYARSLNLLALGEQSACALGVPASRVRLRVLAVAALATAVCVSVSGIIAFVGLIIPHLLRLLVGPDHGRLVPLAALGGAVLLLAADTVTRTLLPYEVPIGVLTALLGGPFFCLVFRARLGRRGGVA